MLVERTLTDLIGGLMRMSRNFKYMYTNLNMCCMKKQRGGPTFTRLWMVGWWGSGENFDRTPPFPPNSAPLSQEPPYK
jgi:hypothetical protein